MQRRQLLRDQVVIRIDVGQIPEVIRCRDGKPRRPLGANVFDPAAVGLFGFVSFPLASFRRLVSTAPRS